MKKEIGFFNWCQYPAKKENTFKQYLDNYEKIITEWTKDLFTSESLLKSLEEEILHLNKNYFWFFKYTYKNIYEVILNNYKYYRAFFNCIKNNKNFKIQIVYIPKFTNETLNEINRQFSNNWGNYVYNEFKKENFYCKARCFYNKYDMSCECIIVLNGQTLNIYDEVELETALDHELNHYFEIFNPDLIKLKKLNPSDKFNILAAKLGYNINSEDFITHILGQQEFYKMCSNVCNILDFQKINYYDWLNMLTDQYLIDIERFNKLNTNLQNILFFSFACRCLDKIRWKKLKQYVYDQLNTKFNIFKSGKHILTDLFLRWKF